MKHYRNLIAGLALAVSLTPVSAQDLLSGETNTAGGSIHAALVAFGEVAKDNNLATIQIQDGQVLTKSMINVAAGKTDIATLPTAAYMLLGKGAGPYKKLGAEKGGALAGHVKALIGFTPGMFIPIVFNDTGITSWEDFRGKRIFVGPPSGAAAVNTKTLIKAVTGMEAGVDYEEIRLGWGAAQQAMLDRKFDVYFTPASDPSPLVQQIVSAGDVTIFGVPEAVYTTDKWKETANRTGTTQALHSTNSYEDGVTYANKDSDGKLHMMAFTFFMGVNAAMSDEKAKMLVETFLSNQELVDKKAAFMPSLRFREGIVGLEATPGLKLHPGAVMALEAANITIPEKLK